MVRRVRLAGPNRRTAPNLCVSRQTQRRQRAEAHQLCRQHRQRADRGAARPHPGKGARRKPCSRTFRWRSTSSASSTNAPATPPPRAASATNSKTICRPIMPRKRCAPSPCGAAMPKSSPMTRMTTASRWMTRCKGVAGASWDLSQGARCAATSIRRIAPSASDWSVSMNFR